MPKKYKQPLSDMVVKAEDCYDPADYYTVHKKYFDGMRAALRKAHGDGCICIYCSASTALAEDK
jgi:hypothetical protein